MRQNRREALGQHFTVPSPKLYPFQWLWDSCFHAIILRHFDLDAARAELRAVLSNPLADGLLPHIIYWKDDYRLTNWGRERRGDVINAVWGVDGTSSLTQPPIIAEAVRLVLTAEWHEAFAYEVYPRLKSYYEALLRERDIDNRGLLGIINPDESGEDNSPRFDDLLDLPHTHTNDAHLDRRLALIAKNAECTFEERCMQQHFWVEDVPFNAIAAVGLDAMVWLAERLNDTDSARFFFEKARTIRTSMRTHMLSEGIFRTNAYRAGTYTPITAETWALFAPLYAGVATDEEALTIIEEYLLNEEKFWTPYPIPSTSLADPCYQVDGFWRGPTWIAVNWFVFYGLRHYGCTLIADELMTRTAKLLAHSGFREQYDPVTGAGFGASQFTWGGLLLDMERTSRASAPQRGRARRSQP